MQSVVVFVLLVVVAAFAAEPREDLKPLGAAICVLPGSRGVVSSHARVLPLAGFSSASPAAPAHSGR